MIRKTTDIIVRDRRARCLPRPFAHSLARLRACRGPQHVRGRGYSRGYAAGRVASRQSSVP